MPEQAFLLISIGPIQDFIASARRCQDLWFGSYLLSHLARTVAKTIQEEGGSTAMIFPGTENLDEKVAVANKIAAIVPADRAADLGKTAEKAMSEELAGIGDRIFDKIEKDPLGKKYLHRKVAEEQVNAMMECQWVVVPCASDADDDYVEARDRAEALLAARKNTRDWFSASNWSGPVPKDSLDGLRESVIDEALYDNYGAKSDKAWEPVRRVFGIRPAERLSGVGLLKRLGQELVNEDAEETRFKKRPHFHSTSHMAAAPLFEHFDKRPEVRDAFDAYVTALGGASKLKSVRLQGTRGLRGNESTAVYDGALLYEGRLEDLLENDIGVPKAKLKTESAGPRKALRALLKEIGHEPNPYYAMLLADGDRMGKIIDAQKSANAHSELSKKLDAFAQHTKAIVEDDHHGSLIYSGGDDVLAIVPLHKAVACARALAKSFKESLSTFSATDPKSNAILKPTLSVGLVMVHHLAHFADVRALAKGAEALAKTQRNALAVIIDKRSGGERRFVGSWDYTPPETDTPLPVNERLAQWMKVIAQGDVSHGFLREVEDVARLADPGVGDKATPEDFAGLLQHELERIMDRKEPGAAGHGDEKADTGLKTSVRAMISAFVKDAERLGNQAVTDEEREKKKRHNIVKNIDQLGSELYFALELHRVHEIAKLPKTHGQEAQS